MSGLPRICALLADETIREMHPRRGGLPHQAGLTMGNDHGG